MQKFYFLFLMMFSISMHAQIVAIADPEFKAMLVNSSPATDNVFNQEGNPIAADTNGDGEIQVSEALAVYKISFSDIIYVENMDGIQAFQNLRELRCVWSGIQNLPVNTLVNLEKLDCQYNSLSSLNVSGLVNLTDLDCHNNQIGTFSVAGLTSLVNLDMNSNWLTSLDLTGAYSLESIRSEFTQLTTLDCSDQHNLDLLYLQENPLVSLFIKNGSLESSLDVYNWTLEYVCVDEAQISNFQWSDFAVNSYCSFTPGGQFYMIEGMARYDANANGCTPSDMAFPEMKYTITNGSQSAQFADDGTGNYAFPVTPGTHTITPNIENPAYFSVNPASATVTFPGQSSPHTANFCLSANGTHNDLDVSIFPITAARPGFDAKYKIVLRNKGTNVQSGSVTFSYNEPSIDFVSATPAASVVSAGNATFNFTMLQPFESREIQVILNLNSPMETPALNGGDIIDITAQIQGSVDETPADNTITLHQGVVNSFDPNDKTCVQGETISTSQVGDYVHYVIRFENTGTYPAENIVVRDVLMANRFQLNTMVPLSSSHPMQTRMTGNKIDFIFENINLPFNDANNDGYVAFKIKTLPTLGVGSSFANSAEIYFDFNFPIYTNDAVTTVQALGTPENIANNFKIVPNPATDIIEVIHNQQAELISIEVYNNLGQLIISERNKFVDISKIPSGTYVIVAQTEAGTSTGKLIKI